MKKQIFPIIICREGKWVVVYCPILDIATQGKTEKEAIENIRELIVEYLKDPDTPKPYFDKLSFPSLSYVEVPLK